MRKFIDFVKKNPICMLMYVIGVVLMFLDESVGAGVITAAVTVVAPGTPEPEAGIAGGETQAPGEATTVSNASELADDLIQPEIDSEIVKIGTDENVLDTIKRRVKRQVQVKSFEVDHYMVDEKNPKALTSEEYVGKSGTKSAALKFVSNDKIFQEYYTAICNGVNGYDPTGQTELPGTDLMIFCINRDSAENPVFIAVNGPKANSTDEDTYMPTIPAGTEIILLASAAYETQKFIAPSTIVPVPERMYLQKQLCNSIVSDYFKAQKKRIPFSEAQVAEAVLRQFRLESCRTAWVGQPGKLKVKAMDASLGYQWDYFSKGLRWQFKRQYSLAGDIEWADVINLSMMKFTGYNTSREAIWLMGKGLLSKIQAIDMTKYRNVSIGEGEVLGFKTTKLKTVFGDISLLHDPTLDALGYTNSGGLIDANGLVRYWMKNEATTQEKVVGEEAKREIIMNIDCLCLKGYSHIWVDGDGLLLPGAMTAKSADELTENPAIGDTIFLTAAVSASAATDNVAFKAGDIVTFNGDVWELNDELKGVYIEL